MKEEKKDIIVIDPGVKDEYFMLCCFGPFIPVFPIPL